MVGVGGTVWGALFGWSLSTPLAKIGWIQDLRLADTSAGFDQAALYKCQVGYQSPLLTWAGKSLEVGLSLLTPSLPTYYKV